MPRYLRERVKRRARRQAVSAPVIVSNRIVQDSRPLSGLITQDLSGQKSSAVLCRWSTRLFGRPDRTLPALSPVQSHLAPHSVPPGFSSSHPLWSRGENTGQSHFRKTAGRSSAKMWLPAITQSSESETRVVGEPRFLEHNSIFGGEGRHLARRSPAFGSFQAYNPFLLSHDHWK